MTSSPTPFNVSFPKKELDDLKTRLRSTRWPSEVEGTGWDHGAPLTWVRSLADTWSNEFDFKRAEERLNEFPNFTARVGATLPPRKREKKGKSAASSSSPTRQQRRERPTSLAPLDVHFIHARANRDRPAAPPPLPLLLLHGWPGSVVEFLAVVGPLADPGPGSPTAQAFDVVVPSLPGFGFSEAPKERGWGITAMASCFHALMTDVLKYNRYCVQGGDWGSLIARRMALDYGVVPAPPSLLEKFKDFFSSSRKSDAKGGEKGLLRRRSSNSDEGGSENDPSQRSGVVALHQNMAIAAPKLSSPRTILQAVNAPFAHLAPIFITKDEAKGLKGLLTYQMKESGYFKIQSTKPMTLGYGLADSPVGVLAWVSEKFHAWGDNGPDRGRNPDDESVGAFRRDDILLNACLYWFGNRGCSSVRIYREVEEQKEVKKLLAGYVRVPTGVLDQPRELFRPPRAWVAAGANLKHFTRAKKGGHFAAMETPRVFVDDVRYHFTNWGR